MTSMTMNNYVKNYLEYGVYVVNKYVALLLLFIYPPGLLVTLCARTMI
jgi:hypothetical protein